MILISLLHTVQQTYHLSLTTQPKTQHLAIGLALQQENCKKYMYLVVLTVFLNYAL